MKINDYLAQQTKRLLDAGISTARLDCLVLFEDVLNTNRTQILAHPEQELTEAQLQTLGAMLSKRAQHIPLAYIRGKTEFYGRNFVIQDHVLEPRPESEAMIDLLKELPVRNIKTIIDVGTGSGALAITAALEVPIATAIATDIDPACLDLARTNAKNHAVQLECYEGDLLEALPTLVSLSSSALLCNLPYVPDNFQINTAASHEPRLALFGGVDGLDVFRKLFMQLAATEAESTYVLSESLPLQHEALANIAADAGYQEIASQDFIQVFQTAVVAS